MKRTFSVLFFIRKTKLLKTGETPILMKITVGGQYIEVNIKRPIIPTQWNQKKERAIGKNAICIEINRYMDALKAKVFEIQKELEQQGSPINPIVIREKLFEKSENCKMFFQVFQEHNERCIRLKGIDFGKTAISRYTLCLQYLREMYKQYSKADDLPMKDVNSEFILNFELFLKTEKKLQQNTMVRYMKCMKKIINMGLANDWIRINPFANIRFREEEVNVGFLTKDELCRLRDKEISIKRLEVVRDTFLFCCYTGLAFIDVYGLKLEHLVDDGNGHMWIRKNRIKTGRMCNIPLLDVPLSLIEKYKDCDERIQEKRILPVISNQKMNGYLKEIATICGITKNLTTHVARHTFATLTLANQATIENVASMLGHSNLKMTQHYARILDDSILRDMDKVSEGLSAINS